MWFDLGCYGSYDLNKLFALLVCFCLMCLGIAVVVCDLVRTSGDDDEDQAGV